jgi:hypothetical protein
MDKRKTNGGAREGAGRKPKADEIKLAETMDAIAIPDTVWKMLYAKVLDSDVNAIKTWLSYRYGMPKQFIEQNNTHEINEDLPVSIVFTKRNDK